MRGPSHPTPADLLARRAVAEPEQPWLFYPEGADWRWRSYGAVAAVAAGREPAPVEAVERVVETLARPDRRPAVLAQQLRAAARRSRGGQVTVLTRPAATPAGRLLVTWSLLAGAALVLEPAASARVPTAAWARVSLFLGDGGEAAALAAAVRRSGAASPGGWWRRLRAALGRPAAPRRPFGRLHTLVLAPAASGHAAPRPSGPHPSATFWRRRDVQQVDLRAVLL